MSYIDQAQDPRRRAAAIAVTAAVHGAIGLGLIVGLTVSGVIPEEDGWDPFTITPDPLPTPPPPEPQPRQDPAQSVLTVPKPPIDIPVDRSNDLVVVDRPNDQQTFVVDPTPRVEPAIEPRPTPMFTPRGARAG